MIFPLTENRTGGPSCAGSASGATTPQLAGATPRSGHFFPILAAHVSPGPTPQDAAAPFSSQLGRGGRKLRVLDLFSGIGGFSLGLERTGGFETVAFCEIEEFPRKVLAKHWPEVPCYHDVRELTGQQLAADGIAVDVITGGFPCQAFSTAARGRNNAPDLWPEMARVVGDIRPQIAICENVKRGPVVNAADFFCGLGMQCDVIRVPANEIGADHERVRWWAVAHTHEDSEFSSAFNAEVAKLPQVFGSVWGAAAFRSAIRLHDGLSGRLDPAGPYGNAVVPQIPEMIGNAILAAEAAA